MSLGTLVICYLYHNVLQGHSSRIDILRDNSIYDHSYTGTNTIIYDHSTFAFRSSEVRRLLLDLDPYGGADPLGMFPLFLKRTADVMAPRLSVVFRRLVRMGSFPACWR